MKRGDLGIPYPLLSVDRAYNTSNAACEVLIVSLLGGTDLNYVAHKVCVRRDSTYRRKQRELGEKAVLSRRKELVDGAGLMQR